MTHTCYKEAAEGNEVKLCVLNTVLVHEVVQAHDRQMQGLRCDVAPLTDGRNPVNQVPAGESETSNTCNYFLAKLTS